MLDKNVHNSFSKAIKDRKDKGYSWETTFIGINSADIKHYNQNFNYKSINLSVYSTSLEAIPSSVIECPAS